jgi:dipeptidyl aminopeptidase/acylaminoacyl peptidase
MTPLIPRRILFGNPEREVPRISPDGRMLAFLAPLKGKMNVFLARVGDIANARALTHDTARGITNLFWAYSGEYVLHFQDAGGDENYHLFATHVESGVTRDLTPCPGARAKIFKYSPNCPDDIIVGLNDRDKSIFDPCRINISSGQITVLPENPDYAALEYDDQYRLRVGGKFLPSGEFEYFLLDRGEPRSLLVIPHEDNLSTGIIAIESGGKSLLILDSRGRNTGALLRMDVESGSTELLAEDCRCDASHPLLHPVTGAPDAIAFEYDRRHWRVLNREIERDFAALAAFGQFEVVSRSLDDRRWIVRVDSDTRPVEFMLWDRDEQAHAFLFTSQPAFAEYQGAPTESHVLTSRDGLALVAYVTRPLASKPGVPLPTVLAVHGGPWARDSWGFNSTHQWLADRGYVAISVNFRGSTGFGKEFSNAGDLAWGAEMQDDLFDVIQWAVDQKISDAEKIGIYGGSYGGYAALAGLAFTPEKFACAVDYVGPSNLVTLLESVPPYWMPLIHQFRSRVGDNTTEDGLALLRERSPLHRVGAICRPLLVAQGANDPRVKRAESDQIVTAMQERGIPVTYLLYPDEGHGFVRPENRLSFYAAVEPFLADHLGGDAEPVGGDFEGSSIECLAGALPSGV